MPSGMQREGGDEVPGRLGDEGGPVPVVLRDRSAPCRAREPAPAVKPPCQSTWRTFSVIGKNRFESAMFAQHRRGHAADRLVVAVRDRHVDARAAVGGRAEEQALLADADAPRVVVRAAEELELRAVGLEPEEALAEVVPLAADLAVEAGVADDRVDPVVEPVPQVATARRGCRAVPKPVKRTLRSSALPSPSVSLRKSMSGACATIRPPLA